MPLQNNTLLGTLRRARRGKDILLSDHQYRTVLKTADRRYLVVDRSIQRIDSPNELVRYGYVSEGMI